MSSIRVEIIRVRGYKEKATVVKWSVVYVYNG